MNSPGKISARIMGSPTRRDAGAVERSGLENRKGRQALGGSNPSPSAKASPYGARLVNMPSMVSMFGYGFEQYTEAER